MATNLDPAEAGKALARLLAGTTQAGAETIRMIAAKHDARARRDLAIAERLQTALGAKDDRVVALRQSSDLSRRLSVDLTRVASKIEPGRVPPPGSFTFTGRVTDPAGTVVPGVRVRLSDPTGAVQVAGSSVTDEFGEFSLEVPANTIDPNVSGLRLVVEDATNRVANTSPSPVELKPGVLQRVDLTVGAPPAPPVDTTPARAPAAGGRRKVVARRKNPQG